MKCYWLSFILSESVIPWIFSKPDLQIRAKKGKKVRFITGLSGSGKTTDAKKYYPVKGVRVVHTDNYFNKGQTIEHSKMGDVIKRVIRAHKPAVVEGVQLPWLRQGIPQIKQHHWNVKRTSFLRSLLNQWNRAKEERGRRGVIKHWPFRTWKQIKNRVKDQLMYKRELEKEFGDVV